MKSKQYRAEVKTRAIGLLIESQKDYPSMWAAIQAIAPKFVPLKPYAHGIKAPS